MVAKCINSMAVSEKVTKPSKTECTAKATANGWRVDWEPAIELARTLRAQRKLRKEDWSLWLVHVIGPTMGPGQLEEFEEFGRMLLGEQDGDELEGQELPGGNVFEEEGALQPVADHHAVEETAVPMEQGLQTGEGHENWMLDEQGLLDEVEGWFRAPEVQGGLGGLTFAEGNAPQAGEEDVAGLEDAVGTELGVQGGDGDVAQGIEGGNLVVEEGGLHDNVDHSAGLEDAVGTEQAGQEENEGDAVFSHLPDHDFDTSAWAKDMAPGPAMWGVLGELE